MNQELICYNIDGSRIVGKALKVVFPKNIEEVKKIILDNENIVIRGSGSNFVGGCIPNSSVVVDMKKMNKVKLEKGSIYAESGATIKEINEKLKPLKLEFPIFLNGEKTLGGMIAINSSGYLGKYGSIKDWIEEIELVNGKGEAVKIKKADLSDVCGIEGLTGIITKVKLKVIPLQERSASIFQADTLEDIWSIARRLKVHEEVAMLRLYSKLVSKLMGFPERYHIFVVFNSERGKIKGKEYNNILNNLKKEHYHLSSYGYYDTDDAKFFFDKLKEFIPFLEELAVPYFSDLSNSFIYFFYKEQDTNKEKVSKMIQKMGGRPGNYGIGIKRKNLLDALQKKIIQSVKSRYDPSDKLNKGKLIDFIVGYDEKLNIDKREEFKKTALRLDLDSSFLDNNLKKKENSYDNEEVGELAVDKEDKFRAGNSNENEDNLKLTLNKEDKFYEENNYEKEDVGKVEIRDNLERKPVITDVEKNLINRIMFNKLDKKDENESKERSKDDIKKSNQ
ncbi:MAG: FAD-binding oxidoreductase [Nanoarchaeota archaeon]